MANTQAYFDMLFGKDDSDDEEEETQKSTQQASSQPSQTQSQPPAPEESDASAKGGEDSSEESEGGESDDDGRTSRIRKKGARPTKATKAGKAAPAKKAMEEEDDDVNGYNDSEDERASGEESQSEDEDELGSGTEGKPKKLRFGAAKRNKDDSAASKNPIQQAIDRIKKRKSRKMDDEEIMEICRGLVESMQQAAKDDRMALERGKPATAKLRKIESVMATLKNRQLHEKLTDKFRVLGAIKEWIQLLPDRSLPLYPVRTPLIDFLQTLHVEIDQLKESGIGKVVMALSKHPDESSENKTKLKEIIDRWSRIITGTHQHSRNAVMEEPDYVRPTQRAEKGENIYLDTMTGRGVNIPVRAGFNFKIIPRSKIETDRGGGEDEAMEVNDRGGEDGGETRKGQTLKRLRDLGKKSNSKKLRAANVTV